MSTIYDELPIAELRPHFTAGNVKTGSNILTFNKLAGSTEFEGCKGTCQNCSAGCWCKSDWKKSPCYVAKAYYSYGASVITCHIKNTIAMRKSIQETFKNLDGQLKRMHNNYTVRIHSAGELESVEELRAWIKLSKKHPERTFYVYTKRVDIVDSVLEQMRRNKKKMLDNMHILISVWHDSNLEAYKRLAHYKNVHAFVYLDSEWGKEEYAAAGLNVTCTCPAYKKPAEGKKAKLIHTENSTCGNCRLCYNGCSSCKVIGCYDH